MSRTSNLRLAGLGIIWPWSSPAPAPGSGANPANLVSVDALNRSLAVAKRNGVNPAMIQSLWLAGADEVQMLLAANGSQDPARMLQIITGAIPPTGQPVTDALSYPAAAIPQYQSWGPLSPDAIASLTNTVNALAPPGGSSWLDWIIANWPWLALGGVGVWWVSKQL